MPWLPRSMGRTDYLFQNMVVTSTLSWPNIASAQGQTHRPPTGCSFPDPPDTPSRWAAWTGTSSDLQSAWRCWWLAAPSSRPPQWAQGARSPHQPWWLTLRRQGQAPSIGFSPGAQDKYTQTLPGELTLYGQKDPGSIIHLPAWFPERYSPTHWASVSSGKLRCGGPTGMLWALDNINKAPLPWRCPQLSSLGEPSYSREIWSFMLYFKFYVQFVFYSASYPCLHIEIQNIIPHVSVVRIQCFHCWGPGSIPGRGTKILQVEQHALPSSPPTKITSSSFLEMLALFTEGVWIPGLSFISYVTLGKLLKLSGCPH